MIATGQRLGLPVYTLGLGSEEEIESGDLRRLASATRGQYYPAERRGAARTIYEQIAERIRASYSMTYQSDRKLADGTLRPVRIFYRGSQTAAGETAIFIPGMVVLSRRLVAAVSGALAAACRADGPSLQDRPAAR